MIDPLDEDYQIVNVGLDRFVEAIQDAGREVVDVEWRPPPDVDADLNEALTTLAVNEDRVIEANQAAFQRLVEAKPVWTDVRQAKDAIPGMDDQTLLHAGPPVTWDRMSGPQRGAVIGALVSEGLADSADEAREVAAVGEVQFAPCHEHQAVGPMAGVIAPSMPVAVVENETHGNRAYTNLNEGLGKVLRYGAFSDEVLERLAWMQAELGPALGEAVRSLDGIDLKLMTAKALHMGDEGHNRNAAGTSLLVRTLASALVDLDERYDLSEIARFIEDNDHFYLNFSMAACKAATDAAAGIDHSTVLTAMARNGTDFGIRVSGLGDEWFTAPAPAVEGLFFPEYDAEDASPDIGDSSITETAGIGGFAMAGAPAITQFVGGTPQDGIDYSTEMYEITVGENPNYTLPPLDFRGSPTGIDLLRVVETGIQPIINTGIAHREPGVGMIGAGVGRAPRDCFLDAAVTFCDMYGD